MDNCKRNDGPEDNLIKDDASIEVISESGDSHARDLEWSIYSAGRSSLAGSDVGSMDFQKLSIHSKMATLVHDDGRQFIERRDLDDGGLPYSAELYLNDEVWKLNGEDCLLMSHSRYFAEVKMEGSVDLDGTDNFQEAAGIILKNVKIVKVLKDKQMEEYDKAKNVLQMVLSKLVGEREGNIHHRRDVMLLRILMQKHGNSLNITFMQDLENCSHLSSVTMTALEGYITKALGLIKRNEILGQLNDRSITDDFINDAILTAWTIHRARLTAICPAILMDGFDKLPDDSILYVSTDDINLFASLTLLDHALLEPVLPKIFSKFLIKARDDSDKQLVDPNPLSNQIFLFICRSLLQVAEQLESDFKTDSVIFYNEEHGWEVPEVQEGLQTLNCTHLRQQLRMIAALANHFEPGGPFRTSRFPYEFKLLQNMDTIAEPIRIWLCLLDDCMNDQVHADSDKMQMLSCFFRAFVSCVASEQINAETLECLRSITHEALRSMVQTSCEQDQSSSDQLLLECEDMISRCLDEFLCEHFAVDCDQIKGTLRRIFVHGTDKNSTQEARTEFCHVLKQLLNELGDLSLDWYLRLPPSERKNLLLQVRVIVPVENRWKNTEHECQKVVDPDGFMKMFKLMHSADEIPKHYQLKAIQMLLDKLAAKQGCYAGKLRKQSLDSTITLIDSTRNAIFHLSRQPDFTCFELYLQKMGELFNHSRMENIDSLLTLENNLQASDPTQTDSNHFDEVLESLPDPPESSTSEETLATGIDLYSTQFNVYLSENVGLPREERIEQIVSDVKSKIRPQLATAWTEEFKRNELPAVLAGLSAVWSLIVSKTGSGSDSEMLKMPSRLQIECVLNFFDSSNSETNRLLYLSSQQGKDLVLGLTAALLALYGHKVLVACYNSNLTRNCSTRVIKMFNCFSVNSDISFGSVEDMARERSRKIFWKYVSYVYQCMGLENKKIEPKDDSNDETFALLIDDIDLFLQNKTLGQAFERYIKPTIPGLEEVDVIVGKFDSMTVQERIERAETPEICALWTFINRSQEYTLLKGFEKGTFTYNNPTLFNDHLEYSKGYKPHLCSCKCRISSKGVLTAKQLQSEIRFEAVYFELRKEDYQQTVNGYNNYGFITIGCIPFPYAHLLKSYPLVLGFASAPLDGYEKITLHDHYQLNHIIAQTDQPQLASVKFDPRNDFLCVDSDCERDWMMAIMVAINEAIERNCSVLVFFKSELEMEQFQGSFIWQLKQLSVVVVDTASNGANFSEHEIAVDEVTMLAIEATESDGHFSEDRPVHVIQTFWSDDRKEEDMIRRQAERCHSSGSYELVILRKTLTYPELAVEAKTVYNLPTYKLLSELRAPRSLGKTLENLDGNVKRYLKIEEFCKKL